MAQIYTKPRFLIRNSVSWTFSHVFFSIVSVSCPADHDDFTWHVDYTVQRGDTWERVSSKFGSFVVKKPDKTLIPSQIVTLDLLCGCSMSADIVSYRVKRGDTLFTICSRFNADMDKTAKLNRLENPGLIYAGDIIFIPEPGGIQNLILLDGKDPKAQKLLRPQIHIAVGIILAAVAVVLVLVTIVFWNYYRKRKGIRRSNVYSRTECLPCYLAICPFHTSKDKSEESVVSSFKSEKATVFPYHEVCGATSNFNRSLKIGQGSYGSVYQGKLRGTDAAIKQMKNTKSKEFLSELNILCKVHHRNVIELIGYAAGGDSLFIVYELAQNGALSDHLHSPTITGYKPLPWTYTSSDCS
ncbi:hypothetical protein L1049_013808 [Liquidambar formosana]|uniref:Uncharacterized protein n=1 Tax=Liquidambar formosana TaxID=63359 RepID=A0AAP0WX54_LIQFO